MAETSLDKVQDPGTTTTTETSVNLKSKNNHKRVYGKYGYGGKGIYAHVKMDGSKKFFFSNIVTQIFNLYNL